MFLFHSILIILESFLRRNRQMTNTNSVVLSGRACQNAKVTTISDKCKKYAFALAVNESYKKGEEWVEETNFFDIEAIAHLIARAAPIGHNKSRDAGHRIQRADLSAVRSIAQTTPGFFRHWPLLLCSYFVHYIKRKRNCQIFRPSRDKTPLLSSAA